MPARAATTVRAHRCIRAATRWRQTNLREVYGYRLDTAAVGPESAAAAVELEAAVPAAAACAPLVRVDMAATASRFRWPILAPRRARGRVAALATWPCRLQHPHRHVDAHRRVAARRQALAAMSTWRRRGGGVTPMVMAAVQKVASRLLQRAATVRVATAAAMCPLLVAQLVARCKTAYDAR